MHGEGRKEEKAGLHVRLRQPKTGECGKCGTVWAPTVVCNFEEICKLWQQRTELCMPVNLNLSLQRLYE